MRILELLLFLMGFRLFHEKIEISPFCHQQLIREEWQIACKK